MSDKKNPQNQRRGRFFRYAPLILWLIVIMITSSRQGSMSNTSFLLRPILEFLFPNATEETLLIYHGYIRKFAHFAEYAALALFASYAFWDSTLKVLQKYWYLFAFLLVVLVASLDELNQSFNPTRTGSIYDVLIDTVGGMAMILFLCCFRYFWLKEKP